MASLSSKWLRKKRIFDHVLKLMRARTSEAAGGFLNTISISMVRNEQDIIEPFLRYHSRLFDLMFVLDNRSNDDTRRIILSVARELGNIVLCDIPDKAQNQSENMTRALHHAQAAAFAEYVFFLDADEFVSAGNKEDLARSLAPLLPGAIGLMPWKTFVPDPAIDEESTPDPLLRLKYQRRNEDPQSYKAVYRAHGGIDTSVWVTQGNHKLRDGFGRSLPSCKLDDLPLLHFPLRSVEQLTAKGVLSWAANQARDARVRSGKEAFQWKRLHEIVRSGKRLDQNDLALEALRYACFDAPASFEAGAVRADHGIDEKRRYSDGRFLSATVLIAAEESKKSPIISFPLPSYQQGQGNSAIVGKEVRASRDSASLFLDVPLIRYALERFEPTSILDIGSGNHVYPLLYKHLGVRDILAIDRVAPEAAVLPLEMFQKADIQIPLDVGRQFDLVACLEGAENLPPDSTGIFFDTVARHARRTILFSMAEPGQPGKEHANCLPISAVLDLWAERGWHPDLAMTLGLRAISSMAWFRRNLLVLVHAGNAGETPAAAVLRQIGEIPFSWYEQKPGKRDFAFSDPLPDLRRGYGLRKPTAR